MKTGQSITADEYLKRIAAGKEGGRQVLQGEKPNKYRNKKTTVDGIVFDSKKEAKHIQLLKYMEKNGKITKLILQPKFKFEGLVYDSGRTIEYWADAEYYDKKGKRHIVDVKGIRTPAYKIKRALMLYWFDLEVEEV